MFFEFNEISGYDPEEDCRTGLRDQKDPKPEYYQYRDEGCCRAESCLNCPFARCYYDLPMPRRNELNNSRRNQEIRDLHGAGKSLKQLSRRFKISERTIERVLYGRRSRAGKPEKEKGDMHVE